MTVTGSIKRSRRNLITAGAFILLIIIGVTATKAGSNSLGLKGRPETDSGIVSVLSEPGGSTLGNGMSVQGGDVLTKLRSLRSPALEREILEIARASVISVIQNGQTEKEALSPAGSSSSPLLRMQAGVFVTLIIDGKVRGCMGRIYPAEPNLQAEIARAARMAATMDMRHPPIIIEDLPKLDFCVSVVGRVRREGPDAEVNPRLEGVLVKTGDRSGVILPGEARTSAYQRQWAKREARIDPGASFELYVFETERFGKTLPVRG